MDIEKIITIINSELKKNNSISVNKVCDKLGLKQSTVKTQLRNNKYSFNADLRQYVKEVGQEVRQDVVQATEPIIEPKKDNVIQGTTSDLMIQNNYLKDNINILVEMIEQYKKHNVVQGKDIVVQLPQEEDGKYKISLRVNKVVMEQFKEFCNKHKQFTQKELISQALINFMEQYS